MKNQETKPKATEETKSKESKQITLSKTLSIALQFSFIILLPLLVFGSVGQWLADRYGNKLWLIAALLLALIISSAWFYQKISDLYKDFID